MRTALLAALVLVGSAAAASGAEFRVVGVNDEELWFIEPAAINADENGVRRAHIYQSLRRGAVLGGKTLRFVDQLFVFDCDAGAYHPEEFVFMDEQFETIGRSPFPDAEDRTPDPNSKYGRIMAAVCGTDPTALGPTITAEDWKAVATQHWNGAYR